MGNLSAELKAALQAFEGKNAVWLFEADLVLTPGAAPTTVRISANGAAAWSQGNFEALVKGFDLGTRGIGILETGLQFSELKVEIADGNRFWSTLIAGPCGKSVRRSPARIRLGAASLTAFSQSFAYFTGVIDRWEFDDELNVTLYLRPDEVMIRRPFPDFQINDLIYPFADPDNALGRYGALLYGIHDSSGSTRTGALPAHLIDSTDNSYFATLGPAEVLAVYADGDPFTDYTLPLETDSGWDVQKIRCSRDMGDAAITFDAKGTKDAAGNVITNPASIAAHVLRNHVFGNPVGNRWRRGPYFTTCPAINVAAGSGFLKVYNYFAQRNRSGAHFLDGDEQHHGEDVLNEILASEFIQAYFRNDGRLDLHLFDPSQRRPATDTLYIRNSDVAKLKPTYDASGIVQKISTQYRLLPVSGEYGNTLEVADLTITNEGTLKFQQPWGPGNEGALVLDASDPAAP